MQMYTNLSTEIIKIPKTGCSHNTIPFLLLFPQSPWQLATQINRPVVLSAGCPPGCGYTFLLLLKGDRLFYAKKKEAENRYDSSSPVLLRSDLMPVHPTKTRFLSDMPGLLHTGAMFSRDELKCSKQGDYMRTAYFSSPYPAGCVRCQFQASAMMCSTSLWTGRQPVTA